MQSQAIAYDCTRLLQLHVIAAIARDQMRLYARVQTEGPRISSFLKIYWEEKWNWKWARSVSSQQLNGFIMITP